MIILYLGNVGSGKTAMAVREMNNNKANRLVYSNIKTTKNINNKVLTPDMIIKKELIKTVKKRSTGEETPVYDYKLNVDFWKSINEPISVILDEAHSIINSRRSMSKTNVILSDWLALIRRVLGSADSGYGELTLITQLPNRIDVIAREMANSVRYHRCHYVKKCKVCGWAVFESNDTPEPLHHCIACRSTQLKKCKHIIECWHFQDIELYNNWKYNRTPTFHRHYFVNDIEKTFPLYDTLQWDNLFSEYY